MKRIFSLPQLLVLIAWAFLLLGKVQAQNENIKIDLYEKKFRCSLAHEAKLELKDLDQKVLAQNLDDVKKQFEREMMNGDISRTERRLLKKSISNIDLLLDETKPKDKLENYLDSICLTSESLLKDSFKALAQTSNLIVLSASLPFRFLKSFYSGIRTGSSDQLEALPAYDLLGEQRSKSIALFLLSKTYSTLQGSNPYLAPFLALPLLNQFVMKTCDSGGKLVAEDVKFCQKFKELKKKMLKASQLGSRLGKRISHKAKVEIRLINMNDINENNFCHYLENVSARKSSKQKAVETREVLLENLNPGSLAKPTLTPYLTSADLLFKESPVKMARLRNVVISLAPSSVAIEKMFKTGEWDDYLMLKKKVSRLTKLYNKLYRLKDIEACQELKADSHLSLAEYQELKQKLQEMKTPAFYEQGLVIQEQFKSLNSKFNLTSKLKMNWDYVSINTLQEVHNILTSENIGNVILITHSIGEYKKLVDSHFNQYPTTFFKSLSPTLMSLSFFTCHSQNILKTYDLESILNSTTTIHQERWLSFVASHDWSTSPDTVPGMGFRDFFQSVDHRLSLSLQENILSQSLSNLERELVPEELCRLHIKLNKTKEAGLSVVLNKYFIGHIDHKNRQSFNFPCSLLRAKNSILIQNSSLVMAITQAPTLIEMKLDDQKLIVKSEKNYFNNLNNFSSKKIEF